MIEIITIKLLVITYIKNGIFTDDENEIANNIASKIKPKDEMNKDKNNRKKYDTRF